MVKPQRVFNAPYEQPQPKLKQQPGCDFNIRVSGILNTPVAGASYYFSFAWISISLTIFFTPGSKRIMFAASIR